MLSMWENVMEDKILVNLNGMQDDREVIER